MARKAPFDIPEVAGLLGGDRFAGTWLDRPGKAWCYFAPGQAHQTAPRIAVRRWDDTSAVELRLIEGDGRRAGFKEHARRFSEAEGVAPDDAWIAATVATLRPRLLALAAAAVPTPETDSAFTTVSGILLASGFRTEDYYGGEVWEKEAGDGCRCLVFANEDLDLPASHAHLADGGDEDGIGLIAPRLPRNTEEPVVVMVEHEAGGFFRALAPCVEDAIAAIEDGRMPETVEPGSHLAARFDDLAPQSRTGFSR